MCARLLRVLYSGRHCPHGPDQWAPGCLSVDCSGGYFEATTSGRGSQPRGTTLFAPYLARALWDPDLEVGYFAVIGLAEITRDNSWRPLRDDFRLDENKYREHWRTWAKVHGFPSQNEPRWRAKDARSRRNKTPPVLRARGVFVKSRTVCVLIPLSPWRPARYRAFAPFRR